MWGKLSHRSARLDEADAGANGPRIFAGPRLDPFFINLAGVPRAADRHQEARPWRDQAPRRYDELVLHPRRRTPTTPQTSGSPPEGMPSGGLHLALRPLVMRQTNRSYSLVQRARTISAASI